MGGGGTLRERLLRLLVGKQEPLKIVPKRISGPRQVPSDWWRPEIQAFLGPQCVACHQNLVKGQELIQGKFCAQCSPRPLPWERTGNGDDLPPAA
jgi:hypothetical protein